MDQKKLILRIKYKTDDEKLIINSLMYFVGEAAIFSVNNLVHQRSTLMMGWMEGETLKTKNLYEPGASFTISKVLRKDDKEVMLIMTSDGSVVIISTKDPSGVAPQITKMKKD